MRLSATILLLPAAALLCGLTLGRVVKVPTGPLYRVVKTPVSIPCNVSDYQGPSEQNFDWFVYRNGGLLKVISTLEPEFSDAEYKDKVAAGDIWVERLDDSSVELRFKSVKFEDEGKYQCQTPSTDANSNGNYEVSVSLKVIPDKLAVLPVKSSSLTNTNHTEGTPMEMQCFASTSTSSTVSTHLSVTWQLTKNGGGPEDILSFSADDQLLPGSSYTNRYRHGDVRMGLEGNGIFRLVIDHLQLEDSGVYSCVAAEWVKEDGFNWKKLHEKKATIKTIEVQPLAQTLKVSASGGILTLNKGDEIDLVCSVTGTDDFSVEVGWYFSTSLPTDTQSSKLLVHMNLAAIVNNSDFVTLNRISSSEYRLKVQQVDEADSGYYYCAASVWVPHTNGLKRNAAAKTSDPLHVTVTLLDPTYTIHSSSSKMPDSSGEPVELECEVLDLYNADEAKLTVAWYFKPTGSDGVAGESRPIAEMDQDWTLKLNPDYNERAQKGEITFTKPRPHTFKFQMQYASVSDRGEYFCNISAWIKQRGNTWMKKQEILSSAVVMFWKTEDPGLSVMATEEKRAAVMGTTFEMMCSVSAEHVAVPYYSVVVAMNEPAIIGTQGSKRLISLTRESVVNLEQWDTKDRPEDVVLEKVSHQEFRFRLYRAQFSDQGSYYCLVQAWVQDHNGRWAEAVSNDSNPIAVAFTTTAPRFNVTLESERPHVHQGETLEMCCIVDLLEIPNTTDVLYEVEWYFQGIHFNATLSPLVSVDRGSVVTYQEDFATRGISVERVSRHGFRLRVHCADRGFAGDYFCKVTPWIKYQTEKWDQIPPEESAHLSVRIDISVLDSFKMPLLYGVVSALLVGILACTIGYCAFPKPPRGRSVPLDERRGLLHKCLS
ncbi:prostaglandin F2 receptor negative regulator-like [Rhinoraja longicauda]